jgi:hypothetical protein
LYQWFSDGDLVWNVACSVSSQNTKHLNVASTNIYEGEKRMKKSDAAQLKRQEIDPFDTPTDLSRDAVAEISRARMNLREIT